MDERTVHDRGKEHHRRGGDDGSEERRRREKRARSCRKKAKEIEATVFKHREYAVEAESLYSDLLCLAKEFSDAISCGKKMAEEDPSLYHDDSFFGPLNEVAAVIPTLVEGYEYAAAQAKKYHQLAMDAAASPVLRLYYSKKHDRKKVGKSEKWQTLKNAAAIAEEVEPEEPVEIKHKGKEEQHREEEKEEMEQHQEEKEDDQAMGCCGGFWRWVRSWGRRNRGRV